MLLERPFQARQILGSALSDKARRIGHSSFGKYARRVENMQRVESDRTSSNDESVTARAVPMSVDAECERIRLQVDRAFQNPALHLHRMAEPRTAFAPLPAERRHEVGPGSPAVNLTASKCRPLPSDDRTCSGASGTAAMCQIRPPSRDRKQKMAARHRIGPRGPLEGSCRCSR